MEQGTRRVIYETRTLYIPGCSGHMIQEIVEVRYDQKQRLSTTGRGDSQSEITQIDTRPLRPKDKATEIGDLF